MTNNIDNVKTLKKKDLQKIVDSLKDDDEVIVLPNDQKYIFNITLAKNDPKDIKIQMLRRFAELLKEIGFENNFLVAPKYINDEGKIEVETVTEEKSSDRI